MNIIQSSTEDSNTFHVPMIATCLAVISWTKLNQVSIISYSQKAVMNLYARSQLGHITNLSMTGMVENYCPRGEIQH